MTAANSPSRRTPGRLLHRGPRPSWHLDAPHALGVEEVAQQLQVDPGGGLSATEVIRRRSQVGRNMLREPKQLSAWQILFDQVRSAVVALLAAAVVAGLIIGELVEAAAVAVVLVVNTVVGFVTEFRAVRSMEALRHLTATRADVEREDRRDEIDAVELVPGDVINVEAGDRVPPMYGSLKPMTSTLRSPRSPVRANRSPRTPSRRRPTRRSPSAPACSTWAPPYVPAALGA